eukprot:Colp12_sorted_trinity150504_noHs@6326
MMYRSTFRAIMRPATVTAARGLLTGSRVFQNATIAKAHPSSKVNLVPIVPVVFRRLYSSLPEIVTIDELKKLVTGNNTGYTLVDVRERNEVAQGFIPTAKNVPLSEFETAWQLPADKFAAKYGFPKPAPGDHLIMYCKAGVRSTNATNYLKAIGYTGPRNYKGSWDEWSSQN